MLLMLVVGRGSQCAGRSLLFWLPGTPAHTPTPTHTNAHKHTQTHTQAHTHASNRVQVLRQDYALSGTFTETINIAFVGTNLFVYLFLSIFMLLYFVGKSFDVLMMLLLLLKNMCVRVFVSACVCVGVCVCLCVCVFGFAVLLSTQ